MLRIKVPVLRRIEPALASRWAQEGKIFAGKMPRGSSGIRASSFRMESLCLQLGKGHPGVSEPRQWVGLRLLLCYSQREHRRAEASRTTVKFLIPNVFSLACLAPRPVPPMPIKCPPAPVAHNPALVIQTGIRRRRVSALTRFHSKSRAGNIYTRTPPANASRSRRKTLDSIRLLGLGPPMCRRYTLPTTSPRRSNHV